jgi:parvulin-like peptidyl-prolyl isomerase
MSEVSNNVTGENLEIGQFQVPSGKIVSLLKKYQMLPGLIRELTIDRAIASIECDATEIATARQQYAERYQVTNQEQLQQWLSNNQITEEFFTDLAVRDYKVEKFKKEQFGNKLESYFMTRKSQLDRAIYSLIRTDDIGIAQEVYFRLCDGEETFDTLSRKYSQGAEAQTGGLIGPVELSTPHPAIANLLATNPSGKICPPIQLAQWYAIVRLEQMIPAQFDDAMKVRMTNELFQTWLQKEMQPVPSQ